MKVFKKVAILLILAVSYFVIDSSEHVNAQSCPARDACLDTAYNNYVNQIAQANQYYISCEQGAAATRNQCLDSADAAKAACEFQADLIYENNLGRCQTISDPYEAEYCMLELESIRQQLYSICDGEFQGWVQSCWWTYSDDDAACQSVFVAFANAAQLWWDAERLACDQLC